MEQRDVFFKAQTMLNELDSYMPDIRESFSNIQSLGEINKIWDMLPNESIDYAVMEKTKNSYCIKSSLEWTDLGTWLALYNLLDKDENDNAISGDVITFDSSNNLIISKEKHTSVVGLNNMAIINLKDRTLVINLEKSEDVRKVLIELEKNSK